LAQDDSQPDLSGLNSGAALSGQPPCATLETQLFTGVSQVANPTSGEPQLKKNMLFVGWVRSMELYVIPLLCVGLRIPASIISEFGNILESASLAIQLHMKCCKLQTVGYWQQVTVFFSGSKC